MDRTPVQSSAVKSLGYEGGVMEVEFQSGHTYAYTGITQQQFDELMALPSKGGAVRMLIAGATTSTRIHACPECGSTLTDRTTSDTGVPTYCDTCDREIGHGAQ